MLFSVALFLFEVKWLIPAIGKHPYLYQGFYIHLSGGPAAWLPLLGPETWEYLMKVFLPFLFLPLFHFPVLMLTFPILAQNILSANEVFRSFNYHYQTGLTPFLFIGTCYSYVTLSQKFQKFSTLRVPFLALLLLVGLVRSGPSEYSYFMNSAKNLSGEVGLIRSELAKIPASARVLTHNNVIPQLCNRKYIYQFEYNGTPTKLDQAKQYEIDYAVFYTRYWEPGTLSWEETLNGFHAAGYQKSFEISGFAIYKKDSAP